MNRRLKTDRRECRRGVVTVEFAICAPLLLFFFFSALEFSRVYMMRQTIENAVYEGSRRGIVPGATATDCRNAAQAVLNTVSINSAQVDVSPAVITPDTSQVTVSVSVPVDNNSWVTPFFFAGRSLSSSMTLRRERFNTTNVP